MKREPIEYSGKISCLLSNIVEKSVVLMKREKMRRKFLLLLTGGEKKGKYEREKSFLVDGRKIFLPCSEMSSHWQGFLACSLDHGALRLGQTWQPKRSQHDQTNICMTNFSSSCKKQLLKALLLWLFLQSIWKQGSVVLKTHGLCNANCLVGSAEDKNWWALYQKLFSRDPGYNLLYTLAPSEDYNEICWLASFFVEWKKRWKTSIFFFFQFFSPFREIETDQVFLIVSSS